jgi:hypothetical protein
MPVLVKSELCCCKFQKGSIHFIKRGLGRSDQAAASDTDTHASRWTVLLKQRGTTCFVPSDDLHATLQLSLHM